MPTFNDILILLPEFYLVAAACLLLLLDAFMKPEQRPHPALDLASWCCWWRSIWSSSDSRRRRVTAFGGMFVRDDVAEILKVFALGTTMLVMVYSRPYLIDRKLLMGEFYTLMIFAVIGIMLLVSAGNLVTVYLGLELLSLSSYALVALQPRCAVAFRSGDQVFRAGRAGLGHAAVRHVDGLRRLGHGRDADAWIWPQLQHVMSYTTAPTLLMFGLIFMIVGIGFKLGAAPFHMWIPDVYQGAPTPVTTFIASGSKLAAFGMA